MAKKHAFVKYTKKGQLIPGSLVITSSYPKETSNGVWEEVPMNLFCCEPITPTPLSFKLLFSDITQVDLVVGDSLNVSDWNTYFDLPIYGNPFTSVQVVGNEVRLFGGSNIIIKEMLFDQPDELGTYLLAVDDQIGSVIELEYDAFGWDNNSGCKNLVTVNFPNVLTVGTYAFNYCEALTTVLLRSAVTIEDYVFSSCPLLTRIDIRNCTTFGSTVNVSDGIFTSTRSNSINLSVSPTLLTCNSGSPDWDILGLILLNDVLVNGSVYYPFSGYSGNLTLSFDNISNATSLVADPTSLSDWNALIARNYSTPFTSINITGNTIVLSGGANIYIGYQFVNNSSLTEVIDTGCVAGIYEIAGGFTNCTSLTTVDFPEVTTLGFGIFSSCPVLSSVNLPKVTSLGNGCFQQCYALDNINFPLLTTTGDYCFNICTSLTSVNLPQLTTAAGATFSQCSSLVSISLPSLTTAGQSCFANCILLTTINLPNLVTVSNSCFTQCNVLVNINLPVATFIGFSCFEGCDLLSTVNLPLVTTIESTSLRFCPVLSSVSIPSCTNLGGTVGNDSVFAKFGGPTRTITLTIPSALMTINGGNPDGDIQYLQSNDTLTVVTV